MTVHATSEIKAPTFLTGIVSKSVSMDLCMDGADFNLQTMAGPVRLKASNDEAQNALERFAGTRLRVTVGGYPTWGPECGYLSVYYAAPAEEVYSGLKQAF